MGMIFKNSKPKKRKAQGILEFGLAFIFLALLFFTIVEYAFFWQTVNSVQTYSDDLNANLALLEGNEVCASSNPEVLQLANERAHRYFNNSVNLQYHVIAPRHIKLHSLSLFRGNRILKVDITCDGELNNSTSTRAEYLYHGLFLFKTGHYISSLSSVHTPKF